MEKGESASLPLKGQGTSTGGRGTTRQTLHVCVRVGEFLVFERCRKSRVNLVATNFETGNKQHATRIMRDKKKKTRQSHETAVVLEGKPGSFEGLRAGRP